MGTFEIVLISCGLCLDLFTVLVCRGALLSKISRKEMVVYCFIFGIWQIGFLVLGNVCTWAAPVKNSGTALINVWKALSSVIFFALSAYFFVKSRTSKPIVECRDDEIKVKQLMLYAFVVSLDAFFAGIGFGLLQTRLVRQIIPMSVVTILSIMLGTYAGYRLGSEDKNKAYMVGGTLLAVGAVDNLLRFTMH